MLLLLPIFPFLSPIPSHSVVYPLVITICSSLHVPCSFISVSLFVLALLFGRTESKLINMGSGAFTLQLSFLFIFISRNCYIPHCCYSLGMHAGDFSVPLPTTVPWLNFVSFIASISSHFQFSRSCPNLWKWKWKSCSVVSDSLPPHGLYSPWNSPGQNTRVGSLSLLQGIVPTQGSNPGLPHCGHILYQLSHKGSPLSFKT